MSKMKTGILHGVLICLPLTAGIETASAEAVPGGTLDPLSIPKYVTPLVIPPVLYDDKACKDDDRKQGRKCDDDDDSAVDFVVSQRQIKQQVLPKGFPKTPLWAYGNPADPSTFNNPAFTIEVTKDNMVNVAWVNELVRNPEKCFDDDYYEFELEDGKGKGKGKGKKKKRKNSKACRYLQHIIQDQNGVPIIDQTLHWAAPNQDCLDGDPRPDCRGASDQPYLGPIPMVVHVHGAHVGPGSDGYPEAWWLPRAGNIDCDGVTKDRKKFPDYACNGTFFESAEGLDTANALGEGYSIDTYPNDQPTTTLWYHDHTLGMTRLNVYAAAAGFWLIRDDEDAETGLVSGALPGPAPKLGDDPNCYTVQGGKGPKMKGRDDDESGKADCVRQDIREIPLAIQPKSFNADGTQYYPADRAFFEGLGTGGIFADNTDVNIPFLPQGTSDIAPVWNPEAFFNTMVVNGSTWPQLEVAQERYRLRFVNASDSRFMNLAMFVVNTDGTLGQEIPFYQIGSDQGLLPAVVRIETGFATMLPGDGSDVGSGVTPVPGRFAEQALLLGPAERPDVIVDFSGLADGTTVRMINTGPDEPFGGDFSVPADPATTGQVMQFVVSQALNNPAGDPSTPAAALQLDPNPGGVPKLGAPSAFQDLALLEEESALLCVTVDAVTGVIDLDPNSVPPTCDPVLGSVPFGPKAAVLGVNGSGGGEVQLWDDPIAQNPALGTIEEWELWNWSADAHPIHLHLVKFEVVNRQIIGAPGVIPPEPWESGWKDTAIMYPGEITRVKALFDIPGLYVWHCHILSHEDNEMMVPFCVGTPGKDCPAELF
ncbi:MAG: multicopper oxidase [Gammaproteobacteria bacterium]